MKKLLATAALMTLTTAFAGDKGVPLTTSAQKLSLYGGVSAGYFFTTADDKMDGNSSKPQLTNAILGLSGETGKDMKVGFNLAVGGSLWATIYDGAQGDLASVSLDVQKSFSSVRDVSVSSFKEGVGILWGYVDFKPFDTLSISAGMLTTNFGYEIADTYSNPNATFGAIWNAQPFIYPGVRLTFSPMDGMNLYAESNQEYGTNNFAVGFLGSLGAITLNLQYYDYENNKNLVDLVFGYSLGIIDIGLNADYQMLDGQSGSAYGVALYLIPNLGSITAPVRLEYFDSGKTNIYTGGSGTSVTITPTYRVAENGFIRLEASYITTSDKVFQNGTANAKTTVGFEAGLTF